ncbi:GGDEF domain-containing protein [Streptomyces alkaliterrae]|uniref:Diguanylate cyclase n=1 Tax=Streptomyces alkaliterrae TaxID=2213162 RepID=A0A5P0YVF8_9ACTN|nr:GGDEF domain-containing protein [Streptomyces alkaliterrae]MBB1258958.1 sensor domain-containing diguanylate cyclase [Streptomyces alkaliterrae]MQS03462.1 diguanylate cyclase [Streptomyces alkaliterrae]
MGDDERLRAVAVLARALARADSPRAAARAAAAGTRAALAGSFAAVFRWERGRGRLRVLADDGEPAAGEDRFPVDDSYPPHDLLEPGGAAPAGWSGGTEPRAWLVPRAAAGADRPAVTVERPERPGVGGARASVESHERRRSAGAVVAPLVLDGRLWGELYVSRRPGDVPFESADAEFASALAAVVVGGLAQQERLAELRRLAFTDQLTGLGNRRAVDDALEAALERHRADGTVVSLVVCDVNGLKQVNDREGHEAGDRLLERFGALLSEIGAELSGSLAARLGGDEFCLTAAGSSADEVVRVAERLCERAAGLPVGEGIACGVASTGDPIGPVDSGRRLLRLADAAQYRAKASRSAGPVVAGREIVALADTAGRPRPGERRSFRAR